MASGKPLTKAEERIRAPIVAEQQISSKCGSKCESEANEGMSRRIPYEWRSFKDKKDKLYLLLEHSNGNLLFLSRS